MAPRTGGDPNNQGHWPEVPHRIVSYLERNVLSKPWANAVALLAAIMIARRFEVSSVLGKIVTLHSSIHVLVPMSRARTDGGLGPSPAHPEVSEG